MCRIPLSKCVSFGCGMSQVGFRTAQLQWDSGVDLHFNSEAMVSSIKCTDFHFFLCLFCSRNDFWTFCIEKHRFCLKRTIFLSSGFQGRRLTNLCNSYSESEGSRGLSWVANFHFKFHLHWPKK